MRSTAASDSQNWTQGSSAQRVTAEYCAATGHVLVRLGITRLIFASLAGGFPENDASAVS